MVLGTGLRDPPAGLGRAGERNVVDVRMFGEGLAGFGAQTRHHVERTRRQAGLRRELGDPDQRETGVLGRLHHAGIADRQRGRHRTPEDLHRVVPRNDVSGDTMRLAQGEDRVARLVGDGLAVQLVGRTGVILEVA